MAELHATEFIFLHDMKHINRSELNIKNRVLEEIKLLSLMGSFAAYLEGSHVSSSLAPVHKHQAISTIALSVSYTSSVRGESNIGIVFLNELKN